MRADAERRAAPKSNGALPRERLSDVPVCGHCKERASWPSAAVALDDASFDACVGRSDLPVLVDIWAD